MEWWRLILLLLGIIASAILIYAGVQAVSIESIAGDTIAEAYYHTVGLGFIGLGVFIIGLSIALATRDIKRVDY